MEWLQTLLDSSTAPALTAFLIGKDIETRRRIFLNGLL